MNQVETCDVAGVKILKTSLQFLYYARQDSSGRSGGKCLPQTRVFTGFYILQMTLFNSVKIVFPGRQLPDIRNLQYILWVTNRYCVYHCSAHFLQGEHAFWRNKLYDLHHQLHCRFPVFLICERFHYAGPKIIF